jgi:hypothetical protein
LSDKIRQDQTRLYISSNDNCSEKCIVVPCVHSWKEYLSYKGLESNVEIEFEFEFKLILNLNLNFEFVFFFLSLFEPIRSVEVN